MANNDANGGTMAKTNEERIALLERQAELNRQALNAMIDRENTFIDFMASAIGQFKMNKVPKLDSVENVVKGDEPEK